MAPRDLTILVALTAGLVSFLSPCVLPLVPAYLGQLTAATVRASESPRHGRWIALRHALAYVLGFGVVFTALGVTATFAGGPLFDALPALRVAGGIVVIVLGLNLAGLLPLGMLARTWRPLEAGAVAARAGANGTVALYGSPSGVGGRLGASLAGGRPGWLSSFGLGVIFAVGWTPCIGAVLGAILTVAATSQTVASGGILLFAYTLGLGIPFLAVGLLYDRAPGLLRPLVRHGRVVSFIGGLLVVAIGVALVMDWLSILARYSPGV